MPFKSQAQRRKFAQLLVEGKIKPETFEEWNRETGGAHLPERVTPAAKKTKKTKKKTKVKKATRKVAAKGQAEGLTFNFLDGLLAQSNYAVAVSALRQANQQDPRVVYLLATALEGKGDSREAKAAAIQAADWNALSNTYGFVRGKARAMATPKS